MPAAFAPELLKMYVFKKHTVLIIEAGEGVFQVDFRNYSFNAGKSLFLAPGQYLQLLSGGYNMLMYEFEEKEVRHIENSRFLFRHLVSIGYVENRESRTVFTSQLRKIDICENNSPVLSYAIEDWLKLNPFNSSLADINLLFNLKEIIDETQIEDMSLEVVFKRLGVKQHNINQLTKEKLNNTVNKLAVDRVLLEVKRKLVFTDLSAKEIAYSTGFKDPDYFNRFFKKETFYTPLGFRKKYVFDERDSFLREFLNLIDTHFKEHHFAEFYAHKLSISVKTLLTRLSDKLATTFTRFMSEKLLLESKRLLEQRMPVNAVAFNLGFKEPNHFSTFFKKLTGKTPTQYLAEL